MISLEQPQDVHGDTYRLILIIMNDFTGANHKIFMEILTTLYSL